MRKDIIKQPGLGIQIKKETCMECNNYTKSFRSYNNKFLCYKCYIKHVRIIREGRTKTLSLQEALNKTYEGRGYINSDGYIYSNISLPSILIGHKFKLVLVDE